MFSSLSLLKSTQKCEAISSFHWKGDGIHLLVFSYLIDMSVLKSTQKRENISSFHWKMHSIYLLRWVSSISFSCCVFAVFPGTALYWSVSSNLWAKTKRKQIASGDNQFQSTYTTIKMDGTCLSSHFFILISMVFFVSEKIKILH